MILFLLFNIFNNAHAAKLTHFTPGTYNLVMGDENSCKTGEFTVYQDEGTKVSLGAYHIFNLANGTEAIPDINEKDKKCTYDVQDSFNNYKNFSTIEFKSVYKCNGETQFTMTRSAKVQKETIDLQVSQVGTPNFKYSCRWQLASRAVNSVKAPKKSPKKK